MSSINERVIANLNKITQLNNEIKRLNGVLKHLRQQKLATEQDIIQCLQIANQDGFEYENMQVINKHTKEKRAKTKQEQLSSMMRVLESNGISNSKEVVQQLMGCTKNVIDKDKLQIKQTKNN